MSGEDLPYFLTRNETFEVAGPEDDLLHPDANSKIAHETLTETQYFGFSIPQHDIHAFMYFWHHPNLGVVSGGGWVWQGRKRHQLEAELNDFRLFMDDAVLNGDIRSYRMPNSYGVEVIEPLKRHRVTYSDAERQNSLDVEYEALMPPIMTADRCHFEQPMKVKGKLTLRGQSYDIDCFTIRDRSWGKPRQEDNKPLPPLTIGQGVFNPDFMFSCFMFDDASADPSLGGLFVLPPEQLIATGSWVYRDGELSPIVSGTKTVLRDRETWRTERVTFDVVDKLGRHFVINGTTGASCPNYGMWPNQMLNFNSIRWECDGHTAHGDGNDALFNDYVQFRGNQSDAEKRHLWFKG